MRKVLFFLLVSSGVLFADIRIPKPWNPGWFGPFGSSPAQRFSGLRLGISWTEPMDGVNCDGFGFFSEWGWRKYRLGASFAHTSLDSIYRSEAFGLEATISPGFWNLGFSAQGEIQIIPGEAADFRAKISPGISAEWIRGRIGMWTNLYTDFEENAYLAEATFSPGKNFSAGVLLHYRQSDHFSFSVGEEFRLGVLWLQGCLSYPGPKVGIGIRIGWKRLSAAFGANRDGNYMDSQMFGFFSDF